MDWARSSFRRAKRHSLGQVIPPIDVGGGDQPVNRDRCRSNSIPAVTDIMKFVVSKKYTVKECRKEKKGVLSDGRKVYKNKKSKREGKEGSKKTDSIPVPGWVSNCTNWIEKKKGSYAVSQTDNIILVPDDKEIEVDVCYRYTTHFLHTEHFNLVGVDSLLGNLVISIVYSPICRLIVRLPHVSVYSVHIPAGPLELVRLTLSSMGAGGGVYSLTPVMCPLAGSLLAQFDKEFPLETLNTLDRNKVEDLNRATKLNELKSDLSKLTGDFLEVSLGEDNFEIFCGSPSNSRLTSPKSPNCQGLSIPRPSPSKLMLKFSPFKLSCFSPEGRTKVKNKENPELIRCLLQDSSESLTNCSEYLHKPYQPSNSPSSDQVEEVFLLEEVTRLREEVNQLRDENNRLRKEMARLNKKEDKIIQELATTNTIVQSLSAMNIV